MSRITTLKIVANRWGWPRAILNLFVKALARYLRIHLYRVRSRRIAEQFNTPAVNSALTFRQIEQTELLVLSEDAELDMTTRFVEDAIARGDLAFGAFDGADLVSYVWRSVSHAPHIGNVWVRVRRPHNYSYKGFTRPAYRGRRINPALFLFADNEMRKLGYEYRVGFVGVTNYASLEMSKHMGANTIGYAGYVSCFGKLLTIRSKAVKETGFEFFYLD